MKIFGLLLCFGSLLLLPARGQELAVAERLQFADGLYARGMYRPAAKEYEALLGVRPDLPEADVALYRLGECYREMGDRPAAEKAYRRVFVEYPDSAYRGKAGFRRARLFMEVDQYESAEALFGEVLEIKPDAAIAAACLYYLGISHVRRDRFNEAETAFRKVITEHKASEYYALALLELGHLLARSQGNAAPGDVTEAIGLYETAAREAKTARIGAEALYQLAALRFRREQYRESAAAYEQLIAAYPDDARSKQAQLQAAWAGHNAGLYVDALKRAELALTLGVAEGRDEWLYLKANCERQLLRSADAVRTYRQLLKDVPDSRFAVPSRYELALTHYRAGEFRAAIETALPLKDVERMRKEVYWLLAESYAALEAADEAIQYYRLITDRFPDSDIAADATFRLAHHLRTQERFEEAATYYGAVADRFPEHELAPRALFAAAFCRAAVERHAEAVRDWSELVARYPQHRLVEEALYQRGVGEIRLQRDADAEATLADFLRRFPESALAGDAHYWLGVLLKARGDLPGAEKALRAALQQAVSGQVANKARFQLAGLLQQTDREAEAAALFQELIQSPLRSDFSPALLEWLATYHLAAKAWDLALAPARILAAREGSAQWGEIGACLVGRALLGQGDAAGAREAFRKALESDGGTRYGAEAALRLGDLALQAAELDPAKGYYARAGALAQTDNLLTLRAHAYVGLGKVAIAQDDPAAAGRYFMSVAVLYDDETLVPEALLNAVRAYRQAGDAEAAASAVAELLERYPESDAAGRAKEMGAPQAGGEAGGEQTS